MPTITATAIDGNMLLLGDIGEDSLVTVVATSLSGDFAIYGQIGPPTVAVARGYLAPSPYAADLLR